MPLLVLPGPPCIRPVAPSQLVAGAGVSHINIVGVIDTQVQKAPKSEAAVGLVPSLVPLFGPFDFLAAHGQKIYWLGVTHQRSDKRTFRQGWTILEHCRFHCALDSIDSLFTFFLHLQHP